jgi:excisionase family DNA binding protein
VTQDQRCANARPQMLSVREVGEIFGREPRTIRSWIAKGRLRPIKVGNSVFIPAEQVEAMLSRSEK